jgi:hypothetical protein
MTAVDPSVWLDRLQTPLDRREGLEAEIAILLAQIDLLWAGADRTAMAPETPLDAI